MSAVTATAAGPSISAVERCTWLTRYPVRVEMPLRYEATKRAMDIALALIGIALALPLFVMAAIAVKLTSRGQIFFSQQRAGRFGRPFTLWKFRTMVRDADQRKLELLHLSVREPPDFKVPRDPRVTHVGRFLRATSIDELPQLVNVLRGDLSLVGPRPTTLMRDGYAAWQIERFNVESGLTGLWQITARGDPSFDTRVRLDIAYATRRCLRLDAEILVRTIPSILHRQGAW